METYCFFYKIKCTIRVSPLGIPREIYNIGMIEVVVSILKLLKLAEDGFHSARQNNKLNKFLQKITDISKWERRNHYYS